MVLFCESSCVPPRTVELTLSVEGLLDITGRRLLGMLTEAICEDVEAFELVSPELTEALDDVELFLLEVEVELDLDEVGSLLVSSESELAKDEVSLSVITDETSDLFTGVVVQATKQKQSITDIKSANSFFMFCCLL